MILFNNYSSCPWERINKSDAFMWHMHTDTLTNKAKLDIEVVNIFYVTVI